MSSPTVLFILDRMRHALTKLPCVMLAFGPGLTIEGRCSVEAAPAARRTPLGRDGDFASACAGCGQRASGPNGMPG